MAHYPRFGIGAESISVQQGQLFKEMTSIFKGIQAERYQGPDQLNKSALNKTIMKYTGILITSNFCERGMGAYVYPPRLTTNNVLINPDNKHEMWNEQAKDCFARARKNLKGTVDVQNSKVGGIFSDVCCDVYIDPGIVFDGQFTAAECAAIFLHEIGHCFTYFEFLIETITTNQVLNSISNRVLACQNTEERVVLLKSAEKSLDIKIQDKDALSKTESKEVVYSVLLTAQIEHQRSSTDSWVYDSKSWEFLSDQFATRHGAGRDLSTALFKFSQIYGDSDLSSQGEFMMTEALTYLSLTWLTFAVWPLGVLLIGIVFISSGMIDTAPHDKGRQRLFRIKHEMVERLKNPKLSDKEKKSVLREIEDIDALLVQFEEHRTLLTAFWDFARPAKRDARKQYLFQQDLEKLASNSLYVSAAKLSTSQQ